MLVDLTATELNMILLALENSEPKAKQYPEPVERHMQATTLVKNALSSVVTPTLEHLKRGSQYRTVHPAVHVQCSDGPLQDDELVILYQDVRSRRVSVRRASEFPTRFKKI